MKTRCDGTEIFGEAHSPDSFEPGETLHAATWTHNGVVRRLHLCVDCAEYLETDPEIEVEWGEAEKAALRQVEAQRAPK